MKEVHESILILGLTMIAGILLLLFDRRSQPGNFDIVRMYGSPESSHQRLMLVKIS